MSDDRDIDLVAGCVMGSFEGTSAPAWLLDRVRGGLGGVLLFAQNVVDDTQVSALCAELHGARHDVIVAIDEEGGDVTRLDAREGSDVPCPAAFGVVDDVALTRQAYVELGTRLREVDIDLTLAPCADVNSNPANPIIGVRAFAATADRAARHTGACVEGFRAAGVRACVKHFPGHGDTTADTHLRPARVTASLIEMQQREFVPFHTAIAAGVEAVLTAHVVAGCVDDRPASSSAAWTERLRCDFGFDGVIITDALDMAAVSGGRGDRGIADAAVAALAAGADLLCVGSNFTAARTDLVIDTLAAALADGRLDRRALECSVARVRALRADVEARPAQLAARRAGDARDIVAHRAIEFAGPFPQGKVRVIECRPRPSMASFNVAWGLVRHLDREAVDVQSIETPEAAVIDDERPIVVVVRDMAVHLWQRTVVERCITARPDTVLVELGWPSPSGSGARTSIVTHGAARSSTRAAAALLSLPLMKEA